MDAQTRDTILAILPALPTIARTTIAHFLRLSTTSHYLSLHTTLIITILRTLLTPSRPQSVTTLQKFSIRDPGVKGRIWIANYASPVPPETAILDALLGAIERPGGPLDAGFRTPALADVEAEWTGYRADVASDAPLPRISERDRFHEMMKECTQPTTVLYLHGGAYYLCDPATHRPTTKKLAQLTGGRCYSVRYRLAPQHPFPAALLDALVSYFTLLYPPPDAYHDPVKPEHIVFAGDSAGGNLALALLHLLQDLRRQNSQIFWHGIARDIPLPAGVAVNSPWLDMTQSSPTWELSTPTPFDYLPKPDTINNLPIPACAAWPSTPPRRSMYVDDALSTHPLASVTMVPSWTGSPPIYICTGWEILAYEDKFLASKLHADGVTVRFEEFEAMAHCFALLLPKLPGAQRCYDGWAGFIRDVVQDPAGIVSSAVTVKAKTLEQVPREFGQLSDVTEKVVRERALEKASMKERTDPSAKL
ncbi:Fc.00g061540.m01.CDS01 [Cosmosporella sp. VM-42]